MTGILLSLLKTSYSLYYVANQKINLFLLKQNFPSGWGMINRAIGIPLPLPPYVHSAAGLEEKLVTLGGEAVILLTIRWL